MSVKLLTQHHLEFLSLLNMLNGGSNHIKKIKSLLPPHKHTRPVHILEDVKDPTQSQFLLSTPCLKASPISDYLHKAITLLILWCSGSFMT